MQVGKQYLSRSKHLALGSLRLLDLDDHLRLAEHLGRGGDDTGAGVAIRIVVHADALACARLDNQLMSVRMQLTRASRSESDPMLEDFDFFGNANAHGYEASWRIGNDATRGMARVPAA